LPSSPDFLPPSPDLLSRSAMGTRFPPAQGPAVDSPEYSTDQCKTGQSHARGRHRPLSGQGAEVHPPQSGDAWGCHSCSAATATPLSPRLTSTGRQGAAKASWALEPDIALGPLTRRKGMPTPMVRLTWGPQPRGRRLRAHAAASCAHDGRPLGEGFGGAGNLGADVDATNADGFHVVIPGKHYADGNRVGSQDPRRSGGTCLRGPRGRRDGRRHHQLLHRTRRGARRHLRHRPRRRRRPGRLDRTCRAPALGGGRQPAPIADVHGETAHCSCGVRSRMRPPVTGGA
jgi:hypothetical protein